VLRSQLGETLRISNFGQVMPSVENDIPVHSSHVTAFCLLTVPSSHGLQDVVPPGAYVPALQSVQSIRSTKPLLSEAEPGGHSVQSVAVTLADHVPSGHSKQDSDAVLLENAPGPH
jgi:hypothetical protein